MKRVRQLSSLILAGVGVGLALAGRELGLDGPYGPGPGFVPFWVGVPLAILSAVWLGQVSLFPRDAAGATVVVASGPGGGRRVAAVVLALVAFALVLSPLGFRLTMLGLLLFLLFAFDRTHAGAKVVVAVVGSLGTHYVFEQFLRVPLPSASLPMLRSFGF